MSVSITSAMISAAEQPHRGEPVSARVQANREVLQRRVRELADRFGITAPESVAAILRITEREARSLVNCFMGSE